MKTPTIIWEIGVAWRCPEIRTDVIHVILTRLARGAAYPVIGVLVVPLLVAAIVAAAASRWCHAALEAVIGVDTYLANIIRRKINRSHETLSAQEIRERCGRTDASGE